MKMESELDFLKRISKTRGFGLWMEDPLEDRIKLLKQEGEIICLKSHYEIVEKVMKTRYGYYIETKKEIRELILKALEYKENINQNNTMGETEN